LKYEIAQQWITALRSNEYPQCTNALRQDGSFCCLGVLADLYIKETGEEQAYWESHGQFRDGGQIEAFSLPEKVIKWAGVQGSDPHVSKDRSDDEEVFDQWATQLNDDERWSFQQIANWVEENWEVL